VNKREADQIVIALRDRGFPVEYINAPDEGHGFARPVNNMAMFASAEKFFAKFLTGRYQEDMKPETAARLKEITVDVKTVTLPKKVEVTAEAPKPASDLQPGIYNYKAAIELGGQSIPLSVRTEIKEDGGSWIVTETADTPQGQILDVSTIEKGSLILKHRSIKQGPLAVELDFKDNKATGTTSMNGQSKPVLVDVGGIIFADGAGAYDVMAHLPLTAGYSTTFRNFDVQKQKAQLKQLKFLGTESVTVPAGTFDAYKIELTAADNESDKQTVWIAKDSSKVVKITAVLPSLGGAKLTSELQ
jgi:hypothetical protein